MAAEAGVDIVDCAIASMSSLTSQPSMNAVVAALPGHGAGHRLDLQRLQKLDDYWADVRLRYDNFDHGLKNPTTDIYRYEIPAASTPTCIPRSSPWAWVTGSKRSRRCTRPSTTCWATS